jgi:hypothetical protein
MSFPSEIAKSLLALFVSSAVASAALAADLIRCETPSGSVLRNDGACPGQARIVVKEAPAPSVRQEQVTGPTIEQLKAVCPAELMQFANTAGKGKGATAGRDYNFRLSMIQAKCASSSMQCYQEFDALYRSNLSGSKVFQAAKQRSRAVAAACGVQLQEAAEPARKTTVCRPLTGSGSLICQ